MATSFFKRDLRQWRVAFTESAAGRVFGSEPEPAAEGEAFLVIRGVEDTWRNLFRLIPGTVATVGREETNRLVWMTTDVAAGTASSSTRATSGFYAI
jgi:hypothetical protein